MDSGIIGLIEKNIGLWFAIQSVIIAVMLLFLIMLGLRFRSLRYRYERLMRGAKGISLEKRIGEYADIAVENKEKTENLEQQLLHIKQTLARSVQHIGLVRFNAFPEVGSNLSFALALLDQEGNGVVISSIYGREETRIFTKPVVNGDSIYHLSEEEKQAINEAMVGDIGGYRNDQVQKPRRSR
ncbi:DUF4446 family protein [Calderihabitans maritimus]|uniref:DUF4446 domain-containing protein n=1 Tax=Calderihabitans maritimus TaxID=1246530 RepID=A0A1Z5HVT4_9FIRM|nr:DUF4446 family protein [Calderihabitans maritimus]GAW93659.1 hypothetical protein KKC1_27870 [Calderihabitans maritimus]